MRSQPSIARLGVIGDVHTEDVVLEAALCFLTEQYVDTILCTGDIADGLGSVSRCCQLLRSAGVHTVRGNHDRWLLAGKLRDLPDATSTRSLDDEARNYLSGLPVTVELDTVAGRLLLCHGLGHGDMAMVTPDDFGYALEVNAELQALIRDPRYWLVVNGHSHRAMVRTFDGLSVVNAGTLRRDHDPCLLIIDLEPAVVRFHAILTDATVAKKPRVERLVIG